MRSSADNLPQKIIVGTTMKHIAGTLRQRLDVVAHLIDEVAGQAARQYPGKGLDLVVLPESAISSGVGEQAKELAVRLQGLVQDTLGTKARQYQSHLVIPIILDEATHYSNAAVLFDRQGEVAGIYRKLYPFAGKNGVIEGGITPGVDIPVFCCDFGKLGIQICWDMSYEENWLSLAQQGVEIVTLCSASPQTVRPSSYALRGQYYVVSSTPRNNATIFSPVGDVVAQTTQADVLVQQIDLSYAIIHWTEDLDNGQAFTRKYGERAGYHYSSREDTGVFWSNDPALSIGSMLRELGFAEMPDEIARVREIDDATRPHK